MTCPHVHRTFRPASSAFHKNRFPQEMHWNLSPVAGGVIIEAYHIELDVRIESRLLWARCGRIVLMKPSWVADKLEDLE
jgi:hypothetical protein